MAKKDNDTLKIFIGIFAWIVGSGIVGGFLHDLSASQWMDFVIIAFVVLWGIFILWVLKNIEF